MASRGFVLTPPSTIVFLISIVLAVLALLVRYAGVNIPVITPNRVFDALAIAYVILQRRILAREGPGSRLRAAVGLDWKGRLSPVLYLLSIPAAYLSTWISGAIYVGVALVWLVPDRRIERVLPPHPPAAR